MNIRLNKQDFLLSSSVIFESNMNDFFLKIVTNYQTPVMLGRKIYIYAYVSD